MLGGLLFLGHRWRTRLLRRLNLRLEDLVRSRTAELEAAHAALREASLVDPLTQLHHRRFVTMTLPKDVNRVRRMFRAHLQQGRSPLELNEDMVFFLCDLDHFKRVNDTFGHAAGDQVLQQAAAQLAAVTRMSDTIARWGGEESLLVVKRTDRRHVPIVADKLCRAIRTHAFQLETGQTARCTVSVGFAALPVPDGESAYASWDRIVEVADKCLYEAKRAGRDGWVGVYTEGPLDAPALIARMRSDLAGAVRDRQLKCHSSLPGTFERSGQA
jgi:diguanylate cyclase (GGDEF)-like protein